MKKITYKFDQQAKEWRLLDNDTDVAKINLEHEYDVFILCQAIQEFVNDESHQWYETHTIKNDNDGLGLIVDIWDNDECTDTATYWFEDFDNHKGE